MGRGRKLLSGVPRPVEWLVGGWNFGGIYTWGTGFPFSVYIPLDQANIGTGSQRADVVGNWKVSSPSRIQWFNPAAFAMPAQYGFGNTGRNILRSPNFSNLDFSIMKQFRFSESHHLEYRAEMFNTFNTANFSYPSATINTSSIGTIFGTIAPNRQIQMALRYEF